jgi:hypothetical protein
VDIYIYKPDFTPLYAENHIISSIWHTYYDDVGTVEIRVGMDSAMIGPVLPQNNGDVILVQGGNSAWVHSESTLGDDGEFKIFGNTLHIMLAWRAVDPFTATDTVENIIRSKITGQFMTSGSNKYMASFALAPAIGGTRTVTYEVRDNQKTLLDVVRELAALEGLGFEIVFDAAAQTYRFRLYRGEDRTAGENMLIFSEDERNIDNIEYTAMQMDYASCGYMQVKNEETGAVSYHEMVKEVKSGFYRREKILTAKTEAEAEVELKKAAKEENIEGDLDERLILGTDYRLGDVGIMQKLAGNNLIVRNRRIRELLQTYEPANISVRPILGKEDI